MVWGQKSGEDTVSRWEARLRENDPKLTSLALLPNAGIAAGHVARLAAALRGNTTLTSLSTSGHPLSAEDARALAAVLSGADPHSGSALECVSVGDSATGAEACSAVLAACAEPRSRVRRVDMAYKGIEGDAASEALARVATAGQVAELVVSRNALGCDGVAAIARHAEAAGGGGDGGGGKVLDLLDLSGTCVADRGARELAAALASGAIGARSLDLSGNEVGDAAAAAVVAGARGTATSLKLSACALSDEFASLLAAGEGLDGLVRLDLSRNELGDAGAEAVARALAGAIADAAHVDVGVNKITARGARALVAAPAGALRVLSLFGNDLRDEGIEAIVAAAASAPGGARRGVATLDVGGNGVTIRGFRTLCDAVVRGLFPDLTEIDAGGNAKDDEIDDWEAASQAFGEQRPHIKVTWRTSARPDGSAQ